MAVEARAARHGATGRAGACRALALPPTSPQIYLSTPRPSSPSAAKFALRPDRSTVILYSPSSLYRVHRRYLDPGGLLGANVMSLHLMQLPPLLSTLRCLRAGLGRAERRVRAATCMRSASAAGPQQRTHLVNGRPPGSRDCWASHPEESTPAWGGPGAAVRKLDGKPGGSSKRVHPFRRLQQRTRTCYTCKQQHRAGRERTCAAKHGRAKEGGVRAGRAGRAGPSASSQSQRVSPAAECTCDVAGRGSAPCKRGLGLRFGSV